MEDDDNFSEILIECVRRIPGLWDKRSEDFARRKSHKDQAWAKVAVECCSDVKTVKDRWRHLRDYYMARRRKQPPSGSAASDATGRRQGRYAQLLSFLSPVAQRGSTTSSAQFLPAPSGHVQPSPAPTGQSSPSGLVHQAAAPDPAAHGVGVEQLGMGHSVFFEEETQFLSTEFEVETGDASQTLHQPTQHAQPTQHNAQQTQATQNAEETEETENTQNSTQETQATQNTEQTQQTQNTQQPQNMQQTQNTQRLPTRQHTSPGTPTSAPKKRKNQDMDSAILAELGRVRTNETDRNHTFCAFLLAELKNRSEATSKIIRRKIVDLLDDYE